MSIIKIGFGLLTVSVLVTGYWLLSDAGLLSIWGNEERLREEISRFGPWSPLILVVTMAMAIVMSPIPSGPIAVVAGAVYGPVWGTVYVVGGALLGAIIAFSIARYFGYEFVCRWLKGHLPRLVQKRPQNQLMGIVFLSRLIPFISFDAVSYAAGLTPLSFWRFILATTAGVIPISLLLTYFGREIFLLDPVWGLTLAVVIGGITLLPLAVKVLRNWLARRKRQPQS